VFCNSLRCSQTAGCQSVRIGAVGDSARLEIFGWCFWHGAFCLKGAPSFSLRSPLAASPSFSKLLIPVSRGALFPVMKRIKVSLLLEHYFRPWVVAASLPPFTPLCPVPTARSVPPGRITTLPSALRALRSADLRSGEFPGQIQCRPGRRPALRGRFR